MRTLSLAIAIVAALGLAWPAGFARADPQLLCSGYAECGSPAFTTHGYQAAANDSWWSMYPGINCTNYAAYVESQVYRVATPGRLLGDAYQWSGGATSLGIPVDQTPSVGAVAVWGRDEPAMSGYGHVAVVESVAADGSFIVVSQSGMGGADDGYDWERITRAPGSWEPWPADFIHFAPSATAPGTLPAPGLRAGGAELVVPGR